MGTHLVLKHILDSKELARDLALDSFKPSRVVCRSAIARCDDLAHFHGSFLERLFVELNELRERGEISVNENLSHIYELFHRSLSDQTVNRDVPCLSKSVSPVLCLHIESGIPVAIEYDHLRG